MKIDFKTNVEKKCTVTNNGCENQSDTESDPLFTSCGTLDAVCSFFIYINDTLMLQSF